MEVKIWDTYVVRNDGERMHFDIIAPSGIDQPQIIYRYAEEYLATKNQTNNNVTSKECQFCHVEEASADMLEAIGRQGYYVMELENC